MSIEEAIIEKLRVLPTDKQIEVLDFTEFLHIKNTPKRPHPLLKGLWADLHIDLSEEAIAEARREMWGNFPRDIDL